MLRSVISHKASNKVLSKIIVVAIFILAAVSFNGLKKLSYPNVSLNKIDVLTSYPGASARDIEINITRPIEEAVKNISGLKEYSSISVDNLSKITIVIEPKNNGYQKILSDISSEIDKISKFPQDLPNRPKIQEYKVEIIPIYDIALVPKDQNNPDWENMIRPHVKRLEKKLKKISELSRVELNGYRDREIHILLNDKLMNDLKISFNDISTAIKNTKLRVAGGPIESSHNQKKLIMVSEFETSRELGNIIVRSNYSGKHILLKDVARIKDGHKKRKMIVRYNGKKGIAIYAFKKSSSDIIKTVDKIKKTIADFKQTVPSDIEFLSTLDMSVDTKTRLTMVSQNLLLGLGMVFLVLMVFLRKRIALWTALGIPISVGMLIILMPLFDLTINSISLCGIIVVLGMVVDDAIIISELIYKNMTHFQMTPMDAAIKAVRSVYRPVLSTILTTIIAFVPIYFIPGMVGKFAQEIPTVIIIILIGSFLEATLMLPTHIIKSYSGSKRQTTVKKSLGEPIFEFMEKHYLSFLNFMTSYKLISLILLSCLVAAGIHLTFKTTKFKMFPEDQANTLYITVENEIGSTLNHTSETAYKLEKIIAAIGPKNLASYRTFVGRKFDGYISCENCFFTKITLTPFTQRKVTVTQIKEKVLKSFEELNLKGVKRIHSHIDSGAPPLGKPIRIMVKNNNDKARMEAVKKLQSVLANFPLKNISVIDRELSKEIHIYPDYRKTSRSQLSVSQIAYTVRTAFEGDVVSEITTNEENIPIRMTLDKDIHDIKKPFKNLYVLNTKNQLLEVDNYVSTKMALENKIIFHHNGERTNTITADILDPNQGPNKIYKMIKNHLANVPLNGSELQFEGEGKESSQMVENLIITFIVALFGIYTILSLQFQSFSLPVLILLVQPFGLVGVGLMFFLHNMDLSYFALVGIIGCTGVIVNDSLIMIDFINKLYKSKGNENKIELIKQGAKERLRPILLTTITTLAGLFPSAYAIIGDVDVFVSPMVMSMGWGLFFGTISVLIVIPLTFSIYEEIKNSLSGILFK